VGSLRCGPNGGSDGVASFEEDVDDMDGGETVRAGDEDFTSWGDSWHALEFVISDVREFGDLEVVGGEIRDNQGDPFYILLETCSEKHPLQSSLRDSCA